MKIIQIRNLKGMWNEKFYGKEKNVIYLDKEELQLTKEEIDEVRKQQCKQYHDPEAAIEYEEACRKAAIIENYLNEISALTELEETKKIFKHLNTTMLDIVRRKSNM